MKLNSTRRWKLSGMVVLELLDVCKLGFTYTATGPTHRNPTRALLTHIMLCVALRCIALHFPLASLQYLQSLSLPVLTIGQSVSRSVWRKGVWAQVLGLPRYDCSAVPCMATYIHVLSSKPNKPSVHSARTTYIYKARPRNKPVQPSRQPRDANKSKEGLLTALFTSSSSRLVSFLRSGDC